MPRFILYLIVPCVLGLLSGCATSTPSTFGGDCYNKSLPILLDSTDLKALFQDIAAELCGETSYACLPQTEEGKGNTQTCTNSEEMNPVAVLVTDFADIQSFLPNQSGLLMGELMRGSLNKVCNYKIIQAEFAKYFKLSENGLVVLTRKVNEIKKDEYSQSEAVVGTYSYLNNSKVVIFVRKINITTGKISRMVTREVNYACTGRSVSGYTAK
jgi:hypothetical protein